jgi:hypothetical protein
VEDEAQISLAFQLYQSEGEGNFKTKFFLPRSGSCDSLDHSLLIASLSPLILQVSHCWLWQKNFSMQLLVNSLSS